MIDLINYSGMIFCFIGGYMLHKHKEKIVSLLKTAKFFLVNYHTITHSKQFNDFYEDYISQKDFVKEVDIYDE